MAAVFIVGKGAFGSALGMVATAAGHKVTYWQRGQSFAPLAHATIALYCLPAQTLPSIIPHLTADLPRSTPLLLCCKGLNQGTHQRSSEIVADYLPAHPTAVLSGPGFAAEITQHRPTAMVIAAPNLKLAEELSALLATPFFRPYASDDMTGTELGGALKNPLAIGAGIIAGAGLGENARAAFITRGLAELTRLAVAAGAKPTTLMGLAGLGDVILTASSMQSRNYAYGVALGSGQPAPTGKTIEGIATLPAALALGARYQVDLPLLQAVHDLVYQHQTLKNVLASLLARPLTTE